VANDANASAVRHGNATGIVFWTASSVAGYSSTIPSVIYATPTDLYAADPTNGTGTYQISIPGGARMTVPRNGGATVHVSLRPARHRAAR
jgi:hypothetical protein